MEEKNKIIDNLNEKISEFISGVVILSNKQHSLNTLREIEAIIKKHSDLINIFLEQVSNNDKVVSFILDNTEVPSIKKIEENVASQKASNTLFSSIPILSIPKDILLERLNSFNSGLGFSEANAFIFQEKDNVFDFIHNNTKDSDILKLLEVPENIEKILNKDPNLLSQKEKECVNLLTIWVEKNLYILPRIEDGKLTPKPVSGDLLGLSDSNNKQTRMLNKLNIQGNSHYNIKYLPENEAKKIINSNNQILSRTNTAFVSLKNIRKSSLTIDRKAEMFLQSTIKNTIMIALQASITPRVSKKEDNKLFNSENTIKVEMNTNNTISKIRERIKGG